MSENIFSNKLPPRNISAEVSVLGAMLQYPEAIPRAIEILKPDDFFREAHQLIYEAICSLFAKDETVDPITVADTLKKKNRLDKIGGEQYLVKLIEDVASLSNIDAHAKQIKNKSILRKLISAAEDIVEKAYQETDDAIEIVTEAEQTIFNIATDQPDKGFRHIGDFFTSIFEHIDSLSKRTTDTTGVPSHFKQLDRMTSGFQKSDLIILAARPSMGKTSFALNIAARTAIDSKNVVGIFSMEMSKEALIQRLICAEARLDYHRFRNGFYSKDDIDKLYSSLEGLYSAPIYIEDTPNLTILEMKALARRLQAKEGLNLLIVDYLQLMKSTKRSESRVQEVSELTRNLKLMARELNVPIICLSQLSRAVEHRPDKRPQLADLRESGSIEQDADLVMFIYRPEVYKKYEEVEEEEKGLAEIIISKHRNGPCGVVPLTFIKEYMRFEARSDVYDEEFPQEETEVFGEDIYDETGTTI